MRKFIISLAVLGTAIYGYLYSQDFRPLIYRAVEQTVAQVTASATVDKNDFKLLFCGTGSPNRTPDRGQPCTALVADGKLFLFDAGEGTTAQLTEFAAPTGALEAIFLTHLHSDHISGVAEVLHNTWLFGRRHITRTIGPPGTGKMLDGFTHAYEDDLHERTRVLGADNLNNNIVFEGAQDVLVEGPDAKIVYEENGLVISAFLVDHPEWPQAYGYRIEYRDKIVVISGDTAPSDGIRRHAKGADALIHEAVNMEIFMYVGEQMEAQGGPMTKERMKRIASVHTPTKDLAEIARDTSVKNLIITHLIPAMPAIWIADVFFTAGMSDIYKGDIIVARDGQWTEVAEL